MISYQVGKNGEEILSDEFFTCLRQINRLVRASGSPLEGNIFYKHHDDGFDKLEGADPARVAKRRNVHRALIWKRSLLEIGFNGGHSALLALATNPELRYTGIDIATHPYVRPVAEYLASVFGSRFELIEGDSRHILPYLMTHRRDRTFDVFHVDGNHGIPVCRSDISSCLCLPGAGQHLILDDTNAAQIMNIYFEYVSLGYLATETLGGTWEGKANTLARILSIRNNF